MSTIRNMLLAGASVVRHVRTGRPAPVFLSYAITFRCTSRCEYCDLPSPGDELTFEEFHPLMDEFRALGLVRLGLTGGEPLLHPDVGRVLEYCRDMGVMTVMSTNGRLVPDRIDEIVTLDLASVSIDCAGDVHDSMRGSEGFHRALAAVDALTDRGISVVLSAVLTAPAIERIDDFLSLARKKGAMAVFQPYFRNLLAARKDDPLLPDTKRFREAVGRIIRAKWRHPGLVASSFPYLRFIRSNYPYWNAETCLAGRLFFALSPEGVLSPCYPMAGRFGGVPLKPGGVRDAVQGFPKISCQTPCYCNGHLENNLLFRFNPISVIDVLGNLAAFRLRRRPRTTAGRF